MKNSFKVVLISSGQPSLNPRLVKEADALSHAGYEVLVIYQYWNDWGTEMDELMLPGKPWKAIRIGGTPKQDYLIYWFTRLVYKSGQILAKTGINSFTAKLAIGRCSWLLISKACSRPADLYIAHNPGALPAAVKAAKKNHSKCGFDAEDFHRNEVSDDPSDPDVKLKAYVENKYFPLLDYLSTASPLISREYHALFPAINPITILNVFPKAILPQKKKDTRILKLFWFSQTIGADRGIEEIIIALGKLKNERIQLHLLGDHTQAIIEYFQSLSIKNGINSSVIYYYKPIQSDSIVEFASQFDLGMAAETGIPHNRDICLTNKIFTYMSSGLAVIASDTKSQSELIDKYPETGKVYRRGDAGQLADMIDYYYLNPIAVQKARDACIASTQHLLNWENEQHKLISKVSSLLN